MSEIKWIKICTNIFDNEKVLLIEALPEGDAIIVIWFKLLCLAGKQNNDGIFMLNDKLYYTDEMFASIFRRPLNTVRLALKTFEAYGMIEYVNDTVTIPGWEEHQNVEQMKRIREGSRDRMRAKRERDKQKKLLSATEGALPEHASSDVDDVTRNVTRNSRVSDANVTPLDVDVDEEEDKDISFSDGVSGIVNSRPTLEEVEAYFQAERLTIDPRRFYRYYEGRGWVTRTGKPVDDWQKLARTWGRYEKPSASASASPSEKVTRKVPTVEEIMTLYKTDRATAEGMLREDLY